MLNGALTIGTMDGANVEMSQAVGTKNMFIFGMTVQDVEDLDKQGYIPMDYFNKSADLQQVVQCLKSGMFSQNDASSFDDLIENLTKYDRFKVCADFDAYVKS